MTDMDTDNGEVKTSFLAQKVFHNDLILRTICKYLDFPNVKSFRSVCWDWKIVSEKRFKNNTILTLGALQDLLHVVPNEELLSGTKGVEKEREKTYIPADLDKFLKGLKCNTEIPFTAISLRGIIPYSMDILSDFFCNGLGRFMTEVKIYRPIFTDEFGIMRKRVNISPMIPVGVKNLYLNVNTGREGYLAFLSSERLSSIEFLHLGNVTILFSGEKIPVKDLTLTEVKIIVQGMTKGRILVNKYFDFNKSMQKLSLDELYSVDMSNEVIHVKDLSLNSTKNIFNSKESKWLIDTARLSLENNIQNIKIKNIISYTEEITLEFLPKTLEKVTFGSYKSIKTPVSPVRLPILKYIYFDSNSEAASFDITFIPPSVTEIKIENKVVLKGESVFELEKLTLKHFHSQQLMDSLDGMLAKLKPKHLCLGIINLNTENTVATKIIEFIQANPSQKVTVEGFRWLRTESVEDSPFSKMISEKAGSYCFENQIGVPTRRY